MTLLSVILIVLIALTAVLWLPGLAFRLRPRDALAGETPAFDIRTHLSGPLISEGVIYGPLGRVASRFVAEMKGDWQGDAGTLQEAFRYTSGAIQHRKWHMRIDPHGKVLATAHDVLGPARGWQSGAALRLSYRIRLDDSEGGHVLSVTDWMYLMENGTIINHSQMRKFGIKVAELIATIRPAPSQMDTSVISA